MPFSSGPPPSPLRGRQETSPRPSRWNQGSKGLCPPGIPTPTRLPRGRCQRRFSFRENCSPGRGLFQPRPRGQASKQQGPEPLRASASPCSRPTSASPRSFEAFLLRLPRLRARSSGAAGASSAKLRRGILPAGRQSRGHSVCRALPTLPPTEGRVPSRSHAACAPRACGQGITRQMQGLGGRSLFVKDPTGPVLDPQNPPADRALPGMPPHRPPAMALTAASSLARTGSRAGKGPTPSSRQASAQQRRRPFQGKSSDFLGLRSMAFNPIFQYLA